MADYVLSLHPLIAAVKNAYQVHATNKKKTSLGGALLDRYAVFGIEFS